MCVRSAAVRLRPGTKRLLRTCSQLRVPVLIVSAGYSDVIEAALDGEGVDRGAYAIASNRLHFDEDNQLVAVEPAESPITGFNKADTYERNTAWFAQHPDRRTVLVLGDKISDMRMADGARARGYTCFGLGLRNDAPDGLDYPTADAYQAAFDAVLMGDEVSLDSLTDVLLRSARRNVA